MKLFRSYRPGESLLRIAFMVFASAGLTARAGDDIKVYRVPKQVADASRPLPADHPPMANAAAPASLQYKTPEGWNEVAAGQMRVASFNVKGKDGKQADVSVIPLPGKAGGDAPNVNRWRGQVGLGELSAEELKKTAQSVAVGDQTAELYDIGGTNTSSGEPTRILATIQHREGTAWFFKMTGDDNLVASQKEAFIGFLKSVQFVAASTASALPPSHPPIGGEGLPAGHPEVSSTSSAAPVAREGQPKWTVPSGWKEVSGGQFLAAKFQLAGDGGAQAAVNVSMSAGDGGGLEGNVNRWRGQLGLSPLSADELAKAGKSLKVNGGEGTMVEMSGKDARTGQPAKLVGVVVPQGGQTWFYKLMGDAKLVDTQRETFTKFVETVKY